MNSGIPYAVAVCCVWPLIVHFGIAFLAKQIAGRDWSNIQWSEFRWPWSKE